MDKEKELVIKDPVINPFVIHVWSTGFQVKIENDNKTFSSVGPVFHSGEQLIPFLVHQLLYKSGEERTIVSYGQERKRLFREIGERFNGNDPGLVDKMIQEVEAKEAHSPESEKEVILDNGEIREI